MQTRLLSGAAALIVLGGAFFLYVGSDEGRADGIVDMQGQADVSIVLNESGFSPRYVAVDPGTRITFTTTRANQFWPASNEHPTHSLYTDFDPKRPLESGESWSFTATRTGSWSYHDHLRSYYTGRIYVE